MKPRAFWLYALLAFCAVFVIGGITAAVIKYGTSEETSEYRAFKTKDKTYSDWYAERRLNPRQVRFDEALAGHVPAESVEDPALRTLAADLRTLALAGADVNGRAKIISSMFIDERGGLGLRTWITCNKSEDGGWRVGRCSLKQAVATLGNPERLATLLGGDEAAKHAALPDVPEEFRERPVWTGEATHRWPLVEQARAVPSLWLGAALWVIISCAFAAAFFLLGYVTHRRERNGYGNTNQYPNPFTSIPHFLLGWVVYLAMLPGVLLMQTLRLVTSDAQPTFSKLKNRIIGRTFASEHERILAQLEGLESRAKDRPNSEETLKLIQGAIKKVRETENLEELDKLRKVAEDVRLHYEVQEELRESLA